MQSKRVTVPESLLLMKPLKNVTKVSQQTIRWGRKWQSGVSFHLATTVAEVNHNVLVFITH